MPRLSLHLTYILSLDIHLSTFIDEETEVEELSDLIELIYLGKDGAGK